MAIDLLSFAVGGHYYIKDMGESPLSLCTLARDGRVHLIRAVGPEKIRVYNAEANFIDMTNDCSLSLRDSAGHAPLIMDIDKDSVFYNDALTNLTKEGMSWRESR